MSASTHANGMYQRRPGVLAEQPRKPVSNYMVEELKAEFGFYEHGELGAYLDRVGHQVTEANGLTDHDWDFRVLDTDIPNAVAIPNGHVFITRGLLALLKSEAELATVLGHELGHLSANHWVKSVWHAEEKQSEVLLTAGHLLEETIEKARASRLEYSRSAEFEADRIGLEYLSSSPYRADAVLGVMSLLINLEQLEQDETESRRGSDENWQSTHPAAEARLEAVQGALPDTFDGVDGELDYLAAIDGMSYGPMSGEGVQINKHFLHVGAQFSMAIPEGWDLEFSSKMLLSTPPDNDAGLVLLSVPFDDIELARRRAIKTSWFSQGPLERMHVNDQHSVMAEFVANGPNRTTLRGLIGFVEHIDGVMMFLSHAEETKWDKYADSVAASFRSFRTLWQPSQLKVERQRLATVTLEHGLPLDEFVRRHASESDRNTIALLNRIDDGELVPKGVVKTIIGRDFRPIFQAYLDGL